MPYYFENDNAKRNRLYSYSDITGNNIFYYFWYDLNGLPIDYTLPDVLNRKEEGYRYIFEDNTNTPINPYTLSVDPNQLSMIGNPFLSSLDFQQFSADNGISSYQLNEDDSWVTYDVLAGSPVMNRYIAPLQAFFVQSTSGNIKFNYSQSVTRPTSSAMQLKLDVNDNLKEDVIYLKIKNKNYSSWLTLSMQELEGQNMPLTVTNQSKTPFIYASDSNNKRNVIQFEGGYTERAIPIGIVYGQADLLELLVVNASELRVDELILVDKYLGTRTDLLINPNYSLQMIEGMEDRFVLEIGAHNPTYIDRSAKENAINISQSNEMQTVYSSKLIHSIDLFDLQGQKIQQVNNVNNIIQQIKIDFPAGVYLMKTVLMNGESQTDKIIIQ